MTRRAWLPERELYMETVLMLAGPEHLSPPETDSGREGGLQLEEDWSSWVWQKG